MVQIIQRLYGQIWAVNYCNKVAINFEIFGVVPYVIHLGIASLYTVYLVECVGRG